MNICVFGSSSDGIDKSYIDTVYELGNKLASRGHSLIFGAGAQGLMGACARGVNGAGGKMTGVAPAYFNADGVLYDKCTDIIFTESMRERKFIMEEKSDAFIMVPGGVGTFEEFYEVLTLKQLGRHGKAIVIYNVNGYFDSFIRMMKECADKGFLQGATNEIYEIMHDADEILDYIEGYEPEVGRVFKF